MSEAGDDQREATPNVTEGGEDEEEPATEGRRRRPRQYIADRCFGHSKYHPEAKPCCFICFVPPPVYYGSRVLEQNCLCERLGEIGCVDHDAPSIRRKIFTVGMIANLIAFVLSFFACFAIANNYDILQTASFSKGVISGNGTAQINLAVGLQSMSVADAQGDRFQSQLLVFDTFCATLNKRLGDLVEPAQCGSCQEESSKLVIAVILSLILTIPSIFSDITRQYPNYDVNCQKFYGSIVAALSMFSSLYTALLYNNRCFAGFYQGEVTVDLNTTEFDWQALLGSNPSSYVINVGLEWSAGNAYLCMVTATALKSIDIIANLIVPTPSITRDRDEQERYEAIEAPEKQE